MSIVPRLLRTVLRDPVLRDPIEDLLPLVGYRQSSLLEPAWRQANQALNQLNQISRWMDQEMQRAAIKESKDKFEVALDCSQFKPEEINVKLVDNNNLVVEAKHEERSDEHGFISRQFTRRYVLPENIEVDKVESKLGIDGTLSIIAPKRVPEGLESNERRIPITLTNQVFQSVEGGGGQGQQSGGPKDLPN